MGVVRMLIAAVAAAVALLATLPVVLIGAPFWIVSGLTRGIRALVRRIQPREVAWTELIEFVPEIGWKNRGGVRARVREARAFKITTDADGWRGSGRLDDAELVVFGDSFAFGHGVEDRQFFASRMRRVRTKAIGVNGYNMVQQLLWMERLRDRFAGKAVVWLPFYGNDIMDNLHPNFRHYRTPFVRSVGGGDEWEIVTGHVSPEPFPFDPSWGYRSKIAETCTPSFQGERAYSACAALIDRARVLCEGVRSPFAVVGVPDPEMIRPGARRRLKSRSSMPDAVDPELPDRRFAEICAQRGIPFLPLSSILEEDDHFPDDCHWTARGHVKVARALERVYTDSLERPPAAGRREAVRAPTVARRRGLPLPETALPDRP